MDLQNTVEIFSQNHFYDWTKGVGNNGSWEIDIKNKKYHENKLYVCFVNIFFLQFGFNIQYDRLSKNSSHDSCMYQSIVLIIFIVKIAKTPAMSQTSLLTSKMKLITSAEIMITIRPKKLNTTDADIPTSKTGIVIYTRGTCMYAYIF